MLKFRVFHRLFHFIVVYVSISTYIYTIIKNKHYYDTKRKS